MEKEVWKWILNSFPDEGIASIAASIGIKIPGFRQLNPQQKNFNIVRPRIIQGALQPKYTKKLSDFFHSFLTEDVEDESIMEKSIEELLQMVEEEIQPSMLLGMLLSSEKEEHQEKAIQVYIKLKNEEKLDVLEHQEDETASAAESVEAENETFVQLQKELKLAQKIIDKLEKKLKGIEQKNEELKSKEAKIQASLKKRRKEEKNEVNSLKGEIGILKHQAKSISSENQTLQKKVDQHTGVIKTKDEEINRLNALVLKLSTDMDKLSRKSDKLVTAQAGTDENSYRQKVAMIGDPKNNRIQKYNKYELTIIDGKEVQEQDTPIVLDSMDEIWLLTYKVPRSIRKRLGTLVKGKQINEFRTFAELEDHMLKGMVLS